MGNALFLKFYYIQNVNPAYKVSPLPGNTKGISASCIGGLNIGINKFISDERKKQAAEAIKFMTSFETQKYFAIEHGLTSGIEGIYDDKDVCKVLDCEVLKNMQPIARPITMINILRILENTYINFYMKIWMPRKH